MSTNHTTSPARTLCCAPDMCPTCTDDGGHLPACQHTTLMVSAGTVRCTECLAWLPEHADSSPRPGLVAANQEAGTLHDCRGADTCWC